MILLVYLSTNGAFHRLLCIKDTNIEYRNEKVKKYISRNKSSVSGFLWGNKDYYMFTSFHEPADEGLRYLYSEDGIHWDSIPGVWLKPELGQHQLMRDPSMVRTPDGTYHLVWTTSWKGDLGFGYAHSKDLIHWSEQQMIPVMADEPTTINVWAPEIFYDDENDQFMVVWASCVCKM